MIGIEFHEPSEFKLKMAWKLLHKIDKVLFAQMIVTQMLSKHRILTQVAGHAMDVMKILPPLIIGEKEVDMFVNALDDVLTECRKFPGPMWELGNNFVRAAIGSRRTTEAPSGVSAPDLSGARTFEVLRLAAERDSLRVARCTLSLSLSIFCSGVRFPS